MIVDDFTKIVQEKFNLYDDFTREYILSLDESDQNQLLSALSSALYDKIVNKVDEIDFGSIPKSRGNIEKVDGFENTKECLDIMRRLVIEYKQNPECVDTVIGAIQNIDDRRVTFMKAYDSNIEFPMVFYNLIVLAIERSVSFLISTCVNFVKDPNATSIEIALDKTAYSSAENNMLYQQLVSFNKSANSGELDKVLKDVMKNGAKVAEAVENDCVDTPDMNNAPSPFAEPVHEIPDQGETEPDVPIQPKADISQPAVPQDVSGTDSDVVGTADKPIDELNPTNEIAAPIIAGIGIAAVAAGAGLIVYKSLVKVIIPMMRNITYFFVSAQEKFSDTMAVQAQLIEANAYKLQLSTTSELSDEKKKKIVQKQLKIAEKLKKIANKFAINTVKAEKQTQKDIKEDDKKATVVDNGSGTGILF